MNGNRVVIDGRAWTKVVTEHWPPGGRENGPRDLSVTFYDPEDRDQWVCSCRIPFAEADLSPAGLPGVFRRANLRSWRDGNGVYWRISSCSVQPGDAEQVDERGSAGVITFRTRDESGPGIETRSVRGLPPLGLLPDVKLHELLHGDC